MEKEDQNARIMEQCGDSSDDEDDERFPVLGEWREEGFGNPVVQDISSSEFEYRVNEVVQGSKYRTIEDVKDVVKLWTVSLRKEFRVLKSSSKEYEVRCVKFMGLTHINNSNKSQRPISAKRRYTIY